MLVAVSVTAGVALVGVLASVLGRKKALKLGQRRARRMPSGRRTRNSIRSPNNGSSLILVTQHVRM